mmetsp:Transcript_26331/g.26255  ORF Transcript_26331/g.26255 Transcript_26331/m.26255 type:complete len:82 (+) Transcript_26331:617-862(+)
MPTLTEDYDYTEAQECQQIINERENNGELTWSRTSRGEFSPEANLARNNPFAASGDDNEQTNRLTTTQEEPCEGYDSLINP